MLLKKYSTLFFKNLIFIKKIEGNSQYFHLWHFCFMLSVFHSVYVVDHNSGFPLDLLRCESLLGLDPATCSRVLNKNYTLLVSMAPLTNEIRPVSSCTPQVKKDPLGSLLCHYFLLPHGNLKGRFNGLMYWFSNCRQQILKSSAQKTVLYVLLL